MAVRPTDWFRDPDDPLDLGTWPLILGVDDEVVVDFFKQTNGADPVAPETEVWRLPDVGETDPVDVSATLKAAPPTAPTGTAQIRQRIRNAERGRVYRLLIRHGPAGDKRGGFVWLPVEG